MNTENMRKYFEPDGSPKILAEAPGGEDCAVAADSALTREQWLERCAARFISVAGLEPAVAKHQAILQLGWLCDDLGEDPEEAADAEMQEWTD